MLSHITLAESLSRASAQGLDRLDAQLLLLHALGKTERERAWLLAHDTDALTLAQQQCFELLIQRRVAGEPLAYITGHKEFFGLDLQVDVRVLVPRPDTETLVDWTLELMRDFKPESDVDVAEAGGDVLDLGTGSGAVALAIQHARPDLGVHALDASPDALQVAQANAQRLQLPITFMHGSWLTGVQGRYHAIVSNPPYIAELDPHLPALTHEPLQALVSGNDGLDDIRHIVAHAGRHLRPGGWLLLEHG
jgi:release factor glutamine methyltransferase